MSQANTPGPMRRSARIGSAARSVASQSAVSVVIEQGAAGRTPGRPRALPKVKARQSNAYGTSGRIGVASELLVPQTGFAEAFQAQRGAAVARSSEERQSRHSSVVASGRTPSRESSHMEYESEDPPSEEEEEEESEEESEEEDISAETSKSFGMGHEAGMLREPTPQQTPRPPRKSQTATSDAASSSASRPGGSFVDRVRPQPVTRAPPVRPVDTLSAEKLTRPPVREPVGGANAKTPRFPAVSSQESISSGFTPRAPAVKPAQEPVVGAKTPRFPAVPSQEAISSGFTPRAPTTKPAQEPLVGIRAPAWRPGQEPRAGGYTPRILADRPAQPAGAASSFRIPQSRPHQATNGGPVAPRPRPAPVEVEPEVLDAVPEETPLDRIIYRLKNTPWQYYALAALAVLIALAAPFLARNVPLDNLSNRVSDSWNDFKNRFPSPKSSSTMTPVDHNNLKVRLDDAELTLKDIQEYVHNLGTEVPDYVVVSRSPSGSMNVPKQFWDAVISRIRKDGPSIEWDTFVQNNEEKLKGAIGTQAAVIREDLFKAIDSNFNQIAEDLNRKLDAHTKLLLKDAEKVAAKEAKKVAVEHARLRSMALSNLIANVELQHGKPNYFSPGLGANIITGDTSPTLAPDTGVFQRVFQRLVSPRINPPLTVLQSWEEPGDCWCAASDENGSGKAQIAIQLGEPVFPTQLTIEHIPRSSIPGDDIRSAPQNVELWVKSDEPALVRFAFDGERCEEGPPGYQCLGKVRYDRNGANHVQTFLLDGEAQTPVEKVLLRVTSNWGDDHTCFYRVRLHGNGLRPVSETET